VTAINTREWPFPTASEDLANAIGFERYYGRIAGRKRGSGLTRRAVIEEAETVSNEFDACRCVEAKARLLGQMEGLMGHLTGDG
jgi:hypothetical protein